ncbi:unnamed protein product [Brassica oleracea var. botrytis]
MKQRSMRYYVSQHGEMPTDPINVLPSPAGKQVLVQIGTWSRWVEDQFEQKEEKSDSNNNEKSDCENFRLFHLLKQVERSIDASLQNACTKREGTDYTARNSLLISKHFGLITFLSEELSILW